MADSPSAKYQLLEQYYLNNAAEVEKKALTQGITKKQFRNLRKGMGIESNKTGFKGGWEISSPDSNNIQEAEDAQDALLKNGPFEE